MVRDPGGSGWMSGSRTCSPTPGPGSRRCWSSPAPSVAGVRPDPGPDGFDRDRADAFRRALGPATVAMLDASLAKHLRQWGY